MNIVTDKTQVLSLSGLIRLHEEGNEINERDLVQSVACLPSMHEAVGSLLSTAWIGVWWCISLILASTQEVEEGRSEVQGHPQVYVEFGDSLGFYKTKQLHKHKTLVKKN